MSDAGLAFLACLVWCGCDFARDRKGRKYWAILAVVLAALDWARFQFLPD